MWCSLWGVLFLPRLIQNFCATCVFQRNTTRLDWRGNERQRCKLANCILCPLCVSQIVSKPPTAFWLCSWICQLHPPSGVRYLECTEQVPSCKANEMCKKARLYHEYHSLLIQIWRPPLPSSHEHEEGPPQNDGGGTGLPDSRVQVKFRWFRTWCFGQEWQVRSLTISQGIISMFLL